LDLLTRLVDKSLVVMDEQTKESRYRMLETIRQYAREKLPDSGESKMIRDRHLQFFLQLAEDGKPDMRWADAVEWHDRIEADHDNFRLALDWTQQSELGAQSGLRLADALSEFWLTRGYLVEGRERTASALNHARSFERTALFAHVLCDAAWYASFQGDFSGARSFANESLGIFRELGDRLGISNALQVLGTVAIDSKGYALAESTLQEALQIRRDLTNVSVTSLLATMGWAAFGLGDYALAKQRLNEALNLSLAEGRRAIASAVLGGLAEVDLREGRYESASKLIEESLSIQKVVGDRWRIGVALGVWAWIAVLQHDWDSAFSRLRESAKIRTEIGDKGGLVWCLEKWGQVALGKENGEKAVKIFSAAASIRAAMGSSMDPFDQSEYENNIASLRDLLGEGKFKMAWDQGRALTLDAAIAFALEENS
jgi:non-specific serine/threonine protein kinase